MSAAVHLCVTLVKVTALMSGIHWLQTGRTKGFKSKLVHKTKAKVQLYGTLRFLMTQ